MTLGGTLSETHFFYAGVLKDDRRGLKARRVSYDETTKIVFWNHDASWFQATINFSALKRRYFSPCEMKISIFLA